MGIIGRKTDPVDLEFDLLIYRNSRSYRELVFKALAEENKKERNVLLKKLGKIDDFWTNYRPGKTYGIGDFIEDVKDCGEVIKCSPRVCFFRFVKADDDSVDIDSCISNLAEEMRKVDILSGYRLIVSRVPDVCENGKVFITRKIRLLGSNSVTFFKHAY